MTKLRKMSAQQAAKILPYGSPVYDARKAQAEISALRSRFAMEKKQSYLAGKEEQQAEIDALKKAIAIYVAEEESFEAVDLDEADNEAVAWFMEKAEELDKFRA